MKIERSALAGAVRLVALAAPCLVALGARMMRRKLGLLAALCALAAVLAAPTVASAQTSANSETETFNYTGSAQTWTVPYGVTSATFDIYGAQGRGFGGQFSGGNGGRALATIAVTPGTVVQVNVGGQGVANAGGFNGGGTAGNGGGGATDLRRGGTALSDRILIAGGGGGTSSCANQAFAGGGAGSGFNGWAGSDPGCGSDAAPGGGGTQSAGGSVGGTLGQGGNRTGFGGGGGGGGYYGGGAGSGYYGGPGGGGSGFGPSGYGWESGVRSGNGVVTITYTQTVRNLSVSASGPGQGYVSSSPAGISCGNDGAHTDCAEDYGLDAPVTLTANPGSGSTFTGWSGACSGTSTTCTVTMSQARSVQASFGNGPRTLSVSKPGNGSGSVTSSPAGIDCGSTCSKDYAYGTSVTLTASPATGSDFTGWNSGGCSGTSTTCTVTMNQARDVEANFTLQKRTLSATKDGNGSGSLTSEPSGLDCGSTCSAAFDFGTSVKITANPAAGSDFTGWGLGACESSGTSPTCTVTMSQDRSIEGKFVLENRTLTVNKSGNGSGTVTSTPAGIDCGSTCGADYDYGTSVTLTASAAANSDFGGWSGACSDTSTTCTVTMDEARSVGAAFTDIPPETTITKAPKTRSSNTRATFEFTSSESGSTFECRLDEKAFVPCQSPATYRVKKGRHTFEVRAIDGAGTVDPSPATASFRIVRKR